jgi:hypothetical protein
VTADPSGNSENRAARTINGRWNHTRQTANRRQASAMSVTEGVIFICQSAHSLCATMDIRKGGRRKWPSKALLDAAI